MPFYRGKPQADEKKEREFRVQFSGIDSRINQFLEETQVNQPLHGRPRLTDGNGLPDEFVTGQGVMDGSTVERLRQFLLDHDRKAQDRRVIDMSKPIVVPYQFRKWPMTVYQHSKNKPAHERIIKNQLGQEQTEVVPWSCPSQLVHSEAELQEAIAHGWSTEVPPKYTQERQESEGEFSETDVAKFMKSQPLPDFTEWTVKKLIAFALVEFDVNIPAGTAREDVINQIETKWLERQG